MSRKCLGNVSRHLHLRVRILRQWATAAHRRDGRGGSALKSHSASRCLRLHRLPLGALDVCHFEVVTLRATKPLRRALACSREAAEIQPRGSRDPAHRQPRRSRERQPRGSPETAEREPRESLERAERELREGRETAAPPHPHSAARRPPRTPRPPRAVLPPRPHRRGSRRAPAAHPPTSRHTSRRIGLIISAHLSPSQPISAHLGPSRPISAAGVRVRRLVGAR